jgi:hypothetical protein
MMLLNQICLGPLAFGNLSNGGDSRPSPRPSILGYPEANGVKSNL